MCISGYVSNEKKPSTKFHFPLKNAELNKQWIRFVNKRDQLATKHSILCELYFEEKYLRRCEKYTLQWLKNPVPTVYPQKPLSKHLHYQHIKLFGVFQEKNLSQMNCQHFSNEQVFSLKNQIIAYYIFIQFLTTRPNLQKYQNLLELMMIYMCSCNTVTCNFRYPSGLFKVIMQATLKKVSYSENSPAYIRSNTTGNYNELLNEHNQRNFYKSHGRPPCSALMIWYALHLRYTSLQVNRLLLEKFQCCLCHCQIKFSKMVLMR